MSTAQPASFEFHTDSPQSQQVTPHPSARGACCPARHTLSAADPAEEETLRSIAQEIRAVRLPPAA